MKKTAKWIAALAVACAVVLAGCKVVSEPEPIAVQSVTLNTTTLTLAPGDTDRLSATVLPLNADNRTVTWSSSSADVATVDSSGMITAYTVGMTTITAQAGSKQTTCLVIVKDTPVTQPSVKPEPIVVESVTLNAETLTIEPDKTRKLVATVTPSNADDKTVTWSSSDEKIATVSDDGTVTAHAEGMATITAKASDKEVTCTITVKRILISVKSVALNTTSLTLTRGETGKLTATVTPDNADDTTVAWSSSNADVATVDKDGTITAVKAGTATITAQAGDIMAECAVTVNPILVENVTLDKATLTFTRGETGKLVETVTPSNADDKTVKWSSSDTSVAKVSDDGTVTAVSKGTATITVTTREGGKTATCAVTVKLAVENIALDITTVTLEPYMTRKLTATVKPDNADDKTVKWSSSDERIATVDNDGTITAVNAGTVTITAQAGDKQAACLVTVRTDHSYSGGKCTVCGAKPHLEDGTIDDNGVLKTYSGSATTVAIPDGVTKIAGKAFYNNKSLEHVTIPGSVESIEVSPGGYGAFEDCTNLKNVTMDKGVTSIGENVFKNCTSLKSVTIPDSVTNIGYSAFAGCTSLERVEIPYGVKIVVFSAFRDCIGLTSVTISNGVTQIGSYAFAGCTSLTSVDIPNSVTLIEESAFRNCTGLTSVDIPNSVKQIGSSAFEGCTSLTSVNIPNSVTLIGLNAFERCTSLTSVMISNSMKGILGSTFKGCTRLTEVTIPASVTYIRKEAFSGCTSLASVNYTGTKDKWGKIDIDSDSGLSDKKIVCTDGELTVE